MSYEGKAYLNFTNILKATSRFDGGGLIKEKNFMMTRSDYKFG